MILIEKNIINRQSIHPIDTYVHKEKILKILKTSFYSSDLTTYPQKIFQLFFITKLDCLLFRSAGQGILV